MERIPTEPMGGLVIAEQWGPAITTDSLLVNVTNINLIPKQPISLTMAFSPAGAGLRGPWAMANQAPPVLRKLRLSRTNGEHKPLPGALITTSLSNR